MIKLNLRFFTVFCIFLLLGVKISHFFTVFKQEPTFSLGPELHATSPTADPQNSADKHPENQDEPKKVTADNPAPPEAGTKAPSSFDLLDKPLSEIEILQNLSEVKNNLDTEKNRIQKEKQLLQISHEQLDKKLEDLKTLQKALKDLFNTYNDQKKENFKETARIYDNMPAEKAAVILVGLDDAKLVNLISAMKKSAAVIAAMPSEKAKHVTDLLLERVKIAAPKS